MRILIAEDERITRRSLQREVERWGHEVVAVEDGAAAWDEFQRQQFDIVVTDWDMPRMDGYELIKHIRGSDGASYAYLIMLTGRTEKLDLVRGMEAGADDFLAKPFDRDELRVRLSAGERIINLERHLAEQNDKLQAANARMHRDLQSAARIQQELLPTTLPQISGIHFAWRYKPCDELAGDLLNVVTLGNDCAAMYIADVSGHGVAASLVSVSVHRNLSVRHERSSLIMLHGDSREDDRAARPDQVASRLNSLYPMASNGGHYMTLVYASIDATNLQFEYCVAGHPGPVIVRRGEDVRSLETNSFPIGIVTDPEYETATIQLAAGDRIYLFSDGLNEAMNPDREMFDRRWIEATIHGSRDVSLDDSIDALIDAAVAWQRSDHFADDLSILAMEVSPSGVHIPLSRTVE